MKRRKHPQRQANETPPTGYRESGKEAGYRYTGEPSAQIEMPHARYDQTHEDGAPDIFALSALALEGGCVVFLRRVICRPQSQDSQREIADPCCDEYRHGDLRGDDKPENGCLK
jgi:hypothetical protein